MPAGTRTQTPYHDRVVRRVLYQRASYSTYRKGSDLFCFLTFHYLFYNPFSSHLQRTKKGLESWNLTQNAALDPKKTLLVSAPHKKHIWDRSA
jgi:hypothetical protein